ncbi:hypothetical protein EG349_03675 [Chryseobacterium shandongense]|uniref:Aspartyl protease n=1 Tax=Chryseobacterium shandongense TaxID=1493872 RepID=A0AAD0YB09_9FLAO|nr:aspartyl protease family protein [Chryseobacterium shandongense]AZA85950.1 hypothetical protein EG349_03675 [Chryseobacterium shandongense]
MIKILYTFFLCSAVAVFGQGKNFFEKGEVQLQQPVEKVSLKYENNLPFVEVNINGKTYNFIFDSGAPTVISQAIYKELNLRKKYKRSIKDSDEKVQQQCNLPQKLDHLKL